MVSEVSIRISATDQASRVFKGVEDQAHSSAGKLQALGGKLGTGLKVAGLAAAAGVGAAAFALVGFAKNAAEEEAGIARLQTALKNLDAAHRGDAAQVEQVVRSQQK